MQIITISREFGSGGRELGKYVEQTLEKTPAVAKFVSCWFGR